MLTFGGGIHYCLGAHLARLELAEALTVITRRMPNPHRTGPAPWKPLAGITGPTTLPIEFDPGHFATRWSGVAGCFLDELYAGGEAEFGVDVGEVGLHGAR